jgi:hypothetical protein
VMGVACGAQHHPLITARGHRKARLRAPPVPELRHSPDSRPVDSRRRDECPR